MKAAEREQVLVEWNDTRRGAAAGVRARTGCSSSRWSGRRTRSPSHSSGQQLTYRELNQRANQLAHHLRGLGVGPEVRVGAVSGALAGAGGGHAGHPQGGRSLRAAGPVVPGGAAGVHAGRLGGAGAGDAGGAGGRAADDGGAVASTWTRSGVRLQGSRSTTRPRAWSARQPGVRHLHVGLDGQAQGDAAGAPGRCATRRWRRRKAHGLAAGKPGICSTRRRASTRRCARCSRRCWRGRAW